MSKVKKEVVEKKPKVTMISYSVKMVIPTGAYANIQPEIVVKAGTPEAAHEFIAPHLNKLWKEYYMITERRQEVQKEVPASPTGPVAPTAPTGPTGPVAPKPVDSNPVSSVAFTKATQAVTSCLSVDALKLITNQIDGSVKLTEDEKKTLQKTIADRYLVLNTGK